MKIVLGIMVFVVLATIAQGVRIYSGHSNYSQFKKTLIANLALFVPVVAVAVIALIPDVARAAETGDLVSGSGLGFLAAALSTGLAAIGAGYAVGIVGSAALGAVSEDPKIFGKTLIFGGLAEGIAIYGLIVSILILGRL